MSVAMEVGEHEGGDLCGPGVQRQSGPVLREGRCRVPARLEGDSKLTLYRNGKFPLTSEKL